MKKNVLLVVLGVVLPLLASGCIIRHEESAGSYDTPSAAEVKSCSRHDDCHAGCYCDANARRCRTSMICTKDSDCQAGFRCDGRASCVPRDPVPAPDAGATSTSSVPDAAPSSSVPDALGSDALSCDAAAMGGSCAP